MNATVERTSRGYRAWCDTCQDGLNTSSRASAEDWARSHETRRHNRKGGAA